MGAAFAFRNFAPNAKKWLIIENLVIAAVALTISAILLASGTGVENQQAMTIFEKVFLFWAWSLVGYTTLAFIVTPIGWLTLFYNVKQNNETGKVV